MEHSWTQPAVEPSPGNLQPRAEQLSQGRLGREKKGCLLLEGLCKVWGLRWIITQHYCGNIGGEEGETHHQVASLAIRVSKPMKRCPQVQYIIASVKERKAERMDTNFPSTVTHANQGAARTAFLDTTRRWTSCQGQINNQELTWCGGKIHTVKPFQNSAGNQVIRG